MGGEDEAAARDELIGELVAGRYRVIARLGSGGMGAVYRALHVGLRKDVALKIVHRRLAANEEAIARFQREALIGGQVTHPNCVPVVDFGAIGKDSFYLVMELLEGESLGDLLAREGRLEWPRALRIVRHVLRGLGHAHQAGIVHRDIKPDNIFLTREENDPELARVFDFGIAKLLDVESATLTQEGTTVGTPEYLSPEQAFGSPLDGRTDLYSLSIVLFEMLVGRTPFGGREPMAMVVAHVTGEVPAMAEMAPDAAIPPDVEKLVRDGLAKTQEERIPSASQYIARIDALLAELEKKRSSTVVSVAQSAATTVEWSWRRAAPWIGGVLIAMGLATWIAQPSSSNRRRTAIPEVGIRPVLPDPEEIAAKRDVSLKAALLDLERGSTCAERKKAVARLLELGDSRAVPALKRARYRMRGGVLGVGDKNTNSCLKAAADAAAAELSSGAKPGPSPGTTP